MEEKITLCGDNCLACPRYLAKTTKELNAVAKLWHLVGWRDTVVSNEEIKCTGCSSHKVCTYHLTECVSIHGIDKCNQCLEFPCDKITVMLDKSKKSQAVCKKKCSSAQYCQLEKAFFHKESNLKK